MSNVDLYYNDGSKLYISNESIHYAGETIAFRDIQTAEGRLFTPDYPWAYPLLFVGFILSVLGKLRADMTTQDLFTIQTYLIHYNNWDFIGSLLVICGLVFLIKMRDKYMIHIELIDGHFIRLNLFDKVDQINLTDINNALKQGLRYTKFMTDYQTK